MPHLLFKDLPRYECLREAATHYPELDPSACEAFLHLLRTGDESYLFIEKNLSDHGISQGRFGVMMQLWGKCRGESPDSGLTPAELADRTGVTRATMTGLIDTLERDALVKREGDDHDRRVMHVFLTPKAHALLKELLPDHFRRMAALMSPLNEAERRTLVTLLTKILEHACQLNAAPREAAMPASA